MQITINILLNISLNNFKINLLVLYLIVLLVNFTFYIKSISFVLFVYLNSLNSYIFFFINSFISGYFKIHPILFYFFILFYYQNKTKTFVTFKITKLWITNVGILSLMLGSFWALYQLNWGFYWANDPIEISLLMVVCIYLYKIHQLKKKYYFKNIVYIFVLFYIYLIRIGCIYTKHNFFKLVSLFVNFVIFYNYWFIYAAVCRSIRIQKKVLINKYYLIFLLCFIFIPFYLNFVYNVVVGKLLTLCLKYFLFYIVFIINWKNIIFMITHVFTFVIIIIFNNFSLEYFVNIVMKIQNIYNIFDWIEKKNLTYTCNNYLYNQLNINLKLNKIVYQFSNYKTNYSLLKKNLINYI